MAAVSSAQNRMLFFILIIILGEIFSILGASLSLPLYIVGLLVSLITAFVAYFWQQPRSRFASPREMSFQSTKHCGYCGTKIRMNMAFCPSCGKPQTT